MASYSQFLGHHITVQYRTGGFLLPASGTLVADSGRSIFLEQHMQVRGKLTYFRWEIPYQYIVRLEEKTEDEENNDARSVKTSALRTERKDQVSRAAASASAGVPGLLPIPNRPKTA